MIFNMIGSGGSSDKSTIIVRTETNSTVGIYTDDSYSTLIKEATYKGLSSYVTILNQESSCPNYSNYWYFERYNTLSANTMEACDAATPVDARYYADSTISTSMNIADSYTARATTYVYSPIDQTLSISCTTDDDGTVYLNDTVLATLTSTKAKTVSFPLVAGINKITIIYTEGSGGDGWVTNPLFSVNSNITAMWGTYEPMTITIDKTQLASKLGFTSRYCNFIYNGIDWTLDGNTINLSEYGITYAATNTIGMYINFVYKYNIYGEYWLQNLNNGIYYLKATKGNLIRTETYIIDKYGVYRITMAYWRAHVTVTFPSGSSLVSISNGNVTYTCPSADLALGTYTFAVEEAGTYAVMATYTGFSLTADSVVITDNDDTGSTECRLWLYDNSYGQSGSSGANVCASVTGGYTGMSGNVGQGIKYNSDNVSLNSNQTSGMLHPTNQIDLTGFSTLHVECKNDKGTWPFGVQATIGTYLAQGTYGTTQSTVTLDITSVTGSAYVGIGMNNGTGYIYNMWLT